MQTLLALLSRASWAHQWPCAQARGLRALLCASGWHAPPPSAAAAAEAEAWSSSTTAVRTIHASSHLCGKHDRRTRRGKVSARRRRGVRTWMPNQAVRAAVRTTCAHADLAGHLWQSAAHTAAGAAQPSVLPAAGTHLHPATHASYAAGAATLHPTSCLGCQRGGPRAPHADRVTIAAAAPHVFAQASHAASPCSISIAFGMVERKTAFPGVGRVEVTQQGASMPVVSIESSRHHHQSPGPNNMKAAPAAQAVRRAQTSAQQACHRCAQGRASPTWGSLLPSAPQLMVARPSTQEASKQDGSAKGTVCLFALVGLTGRWRGVLFERLGPDV